MYYLAFAVRGVESRELDDAATQRKRARRARRVAEKQEKQTSDGDVTDSSTTSTPGSASIVPDSGESCHVISCHIILAACMWHVC